MQWRHVRQMRVARVRWRPRCSAWNSSGRSCCLQAAPTRTARYSSRLLGAHSSRVLRGREIARQTRQIHHNSQQPNPLLPPPASNPLQRSDLIGLCRLCMPSLERCPPCRAPWWPRTGHRVNTSFAHLRTTPFAYLRTTCRHPTVALGVPLQCPSKEVRVAPQLPAAQ